jgi:hypothetical protein
MNTNLRLRFEPAVHQAKRGGSIRKVKTDKLMQ